METVFWKLFGGERVTEEVRIIQSQFGVVGREKELAKALAAIKANKHLLIEGPVGVGKTVVATAVASYMKRSVFRVDGDERYTEQKLTGWFDPPLVLKNGYVKEAFIPGPLTQAMTEGGVLFVNELNRMPEGVQNVLLPAMDEKKITVPKIGEVKAEKGFVIIATQNPLEFIGTSLLSEALRDRFELIALEYQSEEDEIAIVQKHTGIANPSLLRHVVRIVRETRTHQDVRRGASVRAAMSMAVLTRNMGSQNRDAVKDAAYMALPTRIELRDYTKGTVYQVIEEILDKCSAEKGESTQPHEAGNPKSSGQFDGAPNSIAFGDDLSGFFADIQDIFDVRCIPKEEIGWAIAKNYYNIQRKVKDIRLLKLAKSIAIKAIIHRILQCLGPTKRPTAILREPYAPDKDGEIDLESSIEQMLGKKEYLAEDLILESARAKRVAAALMIDASTSMTGDKLALATASLGVLAYKLKWLDYAIITFNDNARVVKHADEKMNLELLIGELLDTRAMGFTNLEEALKAGLSELNRVKAKNKIGVLITDGHFTVGCDPRELAGQYPKLFVIMIEDYDSRLALCEAMANLGKGKMYKVADFDEIPKVLFDALRSLSSKRSPS